MDLPAGSRQAEDGGNRLRGRSIAGGRREFSRCGAEWPWSYLFLAMAMFFFVLHAAGRSLGLDAWLRRGMATFCEQPTVVRYSGLSFAALTTSRRRS
jgi:hypothetical protein